MAKDPNEHLFRTTQSIGQSANFTTTGADASETPDSLYVYSLGIRDIQAKSIQYNEKEAYVTQPFDIPGNVMEVQLEAEEDHPVFDELSGQAASRQTSVEYYIAYKDKPSANDWVPILPLSDTSVQGERLLLESNGEAQLRFPARMTSIKCYANGLMMGPGTYTLLSEQRVLINNANQSAIYTIDYAPDQYKLDPWTFKLSEYKKDVSRFVETFKTGTAYNKTITLKNHPFIDLARMRDEEDYNPNESEYKPVEVYLRNASIQGRGNTQVKEIRPYDASMSEFPYTYNRTLYEDKSWSELLEYNLDPENTYVGFDYYQWKNKLTFTEHFDVKPLAQNLPYTHGNAEIEVHYDALLTNFRLKIILRRNTSTSQTVTPKVENFSIKFKTIE